MIEHAAYLLTEEGETYAAAFAGGTIIAALHVARVDPDLLAEDVTDALEDGSVFTAEWLNEEWAAGRAAEIAHYFEINI
jgi:hypothetical protein